MKYFALCTKILSLNEQSATFSTDFDRTWSKSTLKLLYLFFNQRTFPHREMSKNVESYEVLLGYIPISECYKRYDAVN